MVERGYGPRDRHEGPILTLTVTARMDDRAERLFGAQQSRHEYLAVKGQGSQRQPPGHAAPETGVSDRVGPWSYGPAGRESIA